MLGSWVHLENPCLQSSSYATPCLVQGPGHSSDFPRYCKPAARFTSSTVFLPVLTQSRKVLPVGRQLCWWLRSTLHRSGHILTAASHNENKTLTSGLERFQHGRSLGALKLLGSRSTGLDCAEMKLPETSLSRVQVSPGKRQALTVAASVRTWGWLLKQPFAAFPQQGRSWC